MAFKKTSEKMKYYIIKRRLLRKLKSLIASAKENLARNQILLAALEEAIPDVGIKQRLALRRILNKHENKN